MALVHTEVKISKKIKKYEKNASDRPQSKIVEHESFFAPDFLKSFFYKISIIRGPPQLVKEKNKFNK